MKMADKKEMVKNLEDCMASIRELDDGLKRVLWNIGAVKDALAGELAGHAEDEQGERREGAAPSDSTLLQGGE